MCKVSVLMTVYNGEKYIFESINSIINQTLQDFELIIVDDGSTDQTVNIIESIQDNRISLFTLNENKGVGYANNYAVQLAKGKYLAKMDADDIANPERLAMQFEYLEQHKDIDVIDTFIEYFSNIDEVEKSERYQSLKNSFEPQLNKAYTPELLSKELNWFCNIVHSTVMYRRNLIKYFHYPLDMKICEDYYYFYQMNKKGIKFYKLPQKLQSIRLTKSSLTATKVEEMLDNNFLIKESDISAFFHRDDRPLAIWGIGHLGQLTFEYIKRNFNIHNIVFIDSFINTPKTFMGIDVFNPRDLQLSNYKVLIASTYGKYEIVELLEKIKFQEYNDFFVVN